MNFYAKPYQPDRIWKGPLGNRNNLNYAYCKGELDSSQRLIWIFARKPDGVYSTSLASAIATLLECRWPTLLSCHDVDVIYVIKGLIHEFGYRRPVVKRTLDERLSFVSMKFRLLASLLWRFVRGK